MGTSPQLRLGLLDAPSHVGVLHSGHNGSFVLSANSEFEHFNGVDHSVGWSDYHCTIDDGLKYAHLLQYESNTDCYVSQNGFNRFRPSRAANNVSCLVSSFVDLDYYNTQYRDLAPKEVLSRVLNYATAGGLPLPSIGGFSGRGLQLTWIFNKTLPAQANLQKGRRALLPLWRMVQNEFVEFFKPFGADPRSSDAGRVLRLSNTFNTKSGQYSSLEEIGDSVSFYELKKWYDGRNATRRAKAQLAQENRSTGNVERSDKAAKFPLKRDWLTLNLGRMNDLEKLAKLRGGRYTDYRSRALFCYASAAYWFHPDKRVLINLCNEFIDNCFQDPSNYSVRSVRCITERVRGVDSIKNRLYTSTVVNYLGVTEAEQRELEAIFGTKEKNRRRTEKRRANGMKSKDEYLAEQTKAKDERQAKAIELRNKGLNNSQIAKELDVTRQSVINYLRSTGV